MKKNNIVAVVVTYNRLNLLKENLKSLYNQDCNCDIILINNNSNDGTDEYITSNLETFKHKDNNIDFIYKKLDENIGGAGGFYTGIKLAAELNYEYIWIMDDDTIPNNDSLSKLMIANNKLKSNYGFISSSVLWTDNTPCEMNKLTPIGEPIDENIIPISSATFVSILFPIKSILDCGLPIKEYFIWGDDKEYTRRLSSYKNCYWVKDSIVIHKMVINAGSNITIDKPERISRYFYAYRNDYVTARNRGVKELFIYEAGFILNSLRIIFKSKGNKLDRLKIMRKGRSAGKKFFPSIEFIR